ncbi:LysR family transcriptional regulator [Serratia marcescens]|uniref:LysR family transcriptional regulator n=2 Tax=Serratia marcescens TaxID=615 RepID=UPI0009F6540A|nr:LysR family transcriptional regulator [Serratia marcescens]OQV32045.1 transcriptional regulator [Serratia nematodiphila]MDV5745799.1 LysR family transcriptional regulator [Serratia marcescens]MDV5750711.1 LysR family transcriptional regulator [Serratia marcescens]MDV5782148.1 LysR family transcriptional regulator [Serratia marcescens]MDV5787090.1 LysR family transcriptional regulator [Serratia marcescens]
MKITLRHIRCALAVTRHGNITQAAEHLNVSQPAVSAALNELEELMGKALFVRQRGLGVTLTPFGRHAMDKAQQIVAGVHELERLADERRTLSGELTLGCFEDLAPYCLPQLLRGLKECHPAIGVSIREYGFDQISKQLSNGTLDAALSYDLGLPERIRSTVLCELSAHALLPADHPLAEQGEVSLRQLCNYPLVLTNQAYSSQHFLELFHFHGLQPQRLSKTYSLELQRGLVANGFGVAVAYTRPFGDHSYDGQPLAIRPIAEPLPPQRIVLAEPRTSSNSPLVNALRERARRWFGESEGFGWRP